MVGNDVNSAGWDSSSGAAPANPKPQLKQFSAGSGFGVWHLGQIMR